MMRAQQTESHEVEILRTKAAGVEAELEAARQELELLKQQQQQQPQPHQPEDLARLDSLREVVGAVRIAVLAPCVKLHLTDGTVVQAGSASQIDFDALGRLLEASVLARFSQVKLVSDDVQIVEGGASLIFPELKDTMMLIQKEVTSRLMAMMRDALP
mmetsp:Transcript_9822/g.22315  ORF Transcript_9822/g.22315 Transcript_9822/m.22315 type:complete len:158 (-) Transcript_9822:338-811(-)